MKGKQVIITIPAAIGFLMMVASAFRNRMTPEELAAIDND